MGTKRKNLPKIRDYFQIPRETLKWEGINVCNTTNTYNPPDLRVKIPIKEEEKIVVKETKLETKAKLSMRRCATCQRLYTYGIAGSLRLIDAQNQQLYFCSAGCAVNFLLREKE